jgi:starvation-inducible DNA-binding protein
LFFPIDILFSQISDLLTLYNPSEKDSIMAQITKNDIPAETRENINQMLGQLLADAIDLYYQAKQAHWNVKGENFIALHQLFDSVASEVSEAVDTIAERIMQLGGSAQGTIRVAAKKSRLVEYPLDIDGSQQHVDALSSAIAAFNKNARKAIDETNDLDDEVSSDMMTGITRGLDKQLWFVESHIKPGK